MEIFFLRNFSLELVRLEEKNDVQLTFDDLYICYVSIFEVFQSSFVLVFSNGTFFPQEIFL